MGVQPTVILAKVKGGRPARGMETSGPASPDSLTGNSPRAALQQKLPEPQASKATGYKAQGTDSVRAKSRQGREQNAQGVGHGSDTHLLLPPPVISTLLPQPGRQTKSISLHPHPSSLLPPSPWQPSSRTRTSKSTFRAVGACFIIAENQRKPGQGRGRTEEDGHTEEGQMEGGREGKRPNRGKGGGDRRLVHQIPTKQPQLPDQQLPSLQTAAAQMQKPHRFTEGQPGSCRHQRGTRPSFPA